MTHDDPDRCGELGESACYRNRERRRIVHHDTGRATHSGTGRAEHSAFEANTEHVLSRQRTLGANACRARICAIHNSAPTPAATLAMQQTFYQDTAWFKSPRLNMSTLRTENRHVQYMIQQGLTVPICMLINGQLGPPGAANSLSTRKICKQTLKLKLCASVTRVTTCAAYSRTT